MTRPSSSAALPALDREWLVADGFGGWAMGTLRGANTRRYHGLLALATRPPIGRVLALHSVVDRIATADGTSLELAAQLFGDDLLLHPDTTGAVHDVHLHEDGRGVSWFASGLGFEVERTVVVPRDGHRVVLSWRIHAPEEGARLTVRPFTPLRNVHHVGRASDPAPQIVHEGDDGPTVRRDDVALTLVTKNDAGRWRTAPDWWRDFRYPEERARGQDWIEDVWSPGEFVFELGRAGEHVVTITAFPPPAPALEIEPLPVRDRHASPLRGGMLVTAADAFIVRRGREGASIIAGYPWFADWGRDAMISLPGLLLATGRYDVARTVLETFAAQIEDGLIPNCFDDHGEGPKYNTVDAPLWFVHAVHTYAGATGSCPDGLLDAVRSIVAAYTRGTKFDIREDEDGLVTAGRPTEPITWMDAQRGGIAFTPRSGKAVEINALWYNALCVLGELSRDRRERSVLAKRAKQTARAFTQAFWWPEREALHDVLVEDHGAPGTWRPDGRFRPNQIFAVSLPFAPLSRRQQRQVVEAVDRCLTTPYGLRTLDPADPGYIPRFEGDLMQRDAAYHNGTVWPWLMGPFGDAWLRVHGKNGRADLRTRLQPLLAEMETGCVGQLAEVYDADPPHRAGGCPAQAWSVAEVLRLVVRLET